MDTFAAPIKRSSLFLERVGLLGFFFCSSSSVLHTGHEEHCTNLQSYQNHREYFTSMKPAAIVVGCRHHSILSCMISHTMLLWDKIYRVKNQTEKHPQPLIPTQEVHHKLFQQFCHMRPKYRGANREQLTESSHPSRIYVHRCTHSCCTTLLALYSMWCKSSNPYSCPQVSFLNVIFEDVKHQ